MHRMSRATVTAAALAVSLSVVGPATAAELPGAGNLSSRLSKLSQPSVRSAPSAVQARRLGLPADGPGSLLRRGNRVLVYARFDRGAVAGLPDLRDAGAEVIDASRRYQTVTVAARPGELRALAGVPRVAALVPALTPVAAAACPSGDAVSEGVVQLNAGDETGEARNAFGVDGSGATVGILSDSYDLATEAIPGGPVATHAKEDVESGDLPGAKNPCGDTDPVEVLEEDESGEEDADEGRAMAQIVHDVAPGAAIKFASAFNGEASFASNVEALAAKGANVIADDVFYLEEPFFQEGPVAVAATQATEAGSTYFSAAGNDNLFDPEGHEIASWETPAYRDAGSCPQEVQELPEFNGAHCLDFDPGPGVDRSFGIKVKPGGFVIVDLQWSEPWEGVEDDLDAFLLNANGNLIAASFEDNPGTTQRPFEVLGWENESSSTRTVQLVVNRYSSEASVDPRLKFALIQNGVEATEYPQTSETDVVGPTIFGHSAGASAISVGAIRFNKLSEPEPYSSRGPVVYEFEPVAGGKPAKKLPEPEILSKPDLLATDCGATTFFASLSGSTWRFCGTSAAAPHAAGVAALMLDEEPGAEPEEIRAAMRASAVSVGAFGPCAVGAGLVEATGAIEELLSPGSSSPAECETPSPEVGDGEARAAGDWGSETPSSPGTPPTPSPPPGPGTSADVVPPRTFIRSHPPHLIRTGNRRVRVVFRFGSDDPEASFVCRIDSGLFRRCPRRFVRSFKLGPHTLRVAARDAAGNGDRTPAVFRFRVKNLSR
jgi:hypothetical protein